MLWECFGDKNSCNRDCENCKDVYDPIPIDAKARFEAKQWRHLGEEDYESKILARQEANGIYDL